MKIWILTREIDDENHDGEYFMKAFKEKPTAWQLKDALQIKYDAYIQYVLDGNTDKDYLGAWYNLFEYELK